MGMSAYLLRVHLVLLMCSVLSTDATVYIFTYSYNRPEFIELQHRTFKKFLRDDYKFIVFNDAKSDHLCSAIERMCEKFDIECIRIPQEIHSRPYLQRWSTEDPTGANCRNANVVMYSLHTKGFKHDDILALIDSDLFLIQPFSIREYLKGYDIAGLWQGRSKDPSSPSVQYLWIGIVFMNMATLPDIQTIDFNCGFVGDVPVDVGGQTYHYLHNHPDVKVRSINTDAPSLDHIDERMYTFLRRGPFAMQFFCADGCWVHYGGGTNWDYRPVNHHRWKYALLERFITLCCQS